MMNNALSDIFHNQTELSRERLSFCEANIKDLNEWVTTLSIMQLGDTSKALFTAILELNELKCSETLRFDLIQTLHPTINNVLASLEKNFFNQGVISTDRNEHIIELAMLLRCYFASIYLNIAQNSHEQLQHQKFSLFAYKQKKNLQTARILSTFHALQQLTNLLYQQHMLYSEPLKGQWLIAHQLYETAVQHKYHLININHIQGIQHPLANITQAYAQLILLDILNTNQIRQSEIQALFQCSFDWARMIHILPKDTALTKYVVDPNKDHPPVYNTKRSSNFNPSIFIGTQALLEHVTATMHKNAQYISKNEKFYLSPALKFHVQTILGTTAQRRHERYEYNAELQICFSLSTAHFYLSKAKNFEETLQLNHNYNLQSESKVLSNLEKKEQQTSSYQRLSRESKTIYQTTVLDISVNGYRIKWSGEAPKNLRTGEYILVKETLHGQWRGGVIRWIKQSTEKSLELGLEILSQAMFPCSVHIQAERHTRNYHPALLLQTQNLEEIQNTLILPGSQIFREQQTIHLRLGTEEIKVYLLKAQLITQSFIQFHFELLNEQQQGLLDQFMMKKGNNSSTQDLWEALK
ncbi:GTPase [Acinetobacter pittii]|uniref:GTPase n=1 Tax=Acinetobacter TaxID=469 RepID=UPI001F0685B5|nr:MULTISPECIES: GTPase [Acinetobacter]MCH2012059.1 GTPase [Acinetobacter pittii]MDA3446657.1 GTPase [Acinetobacter sp. AOR40_HL]MDA3454400.1 GTPase [Acinetobacter sp. AOR39_HL]MDQ9994108.1 GTPase [Acinetobacter pittii]